MIKISNLKKQYDSRGIAGLHDINFALNKGEVLGIMGPNGSGKSTLLKILHGVLEKESGEVHIDGNTYFFPKEENFPQEKNVQKFLIESVTLDIDEEKKLQLTRDLAVTFEFTFQLRQTLGQLSSGQKQKVLLARELINRPSLFLMDEPFAHLDPFTRKDILSSLFEYIRYQEITVLWITHDLEEALKFSDKLALMNFGKFEQFDTPPELITNPKNLFVAQFLGYRNFYPVKFKNGSWASPWGILPYPQSPKEEAFLVVPDHSWKISEEGLDFKIVSRTPGKQVVEYVLSNPPYEAHVSLPVRKKLSEGDTWVKLSPDLEESFLIPL